MSSFNNKSEWNPKEDMLDIVELQEESHASIYNDKISFQNDKLLNNKLSKRTTPTNEKNMTFKPKYFSNFISDYSPGHLNNKIKFNEKSMNDPQASNSEYYKDIKHTSEKQTSNRMNINSKESNNIERNHHDQKDHEFLNTLLRLKLKDNKNIPSFLNENIILKSTTNRVSMGNNEESKSIKVDSCKEEKSPKDIVRNSEIDGISLIYNRSYSNVMSDSKNNSNYFSTNKLFRITSSDLDGSPNPYYSPENKRSINYEIDEITSKRSTIALQTNNEVLSPERKRSTQSSIKIIKEIKETKKVDKAHQEDCKNSKIIGLKVDKNKRYSGLMIDESLKKDQIFSIEDELIKVEFTQKEKVLLF